MAASHASTIEHRFKQRIPFHKDVVIYQNRIPIAVGKTRDISFDGMGISCEMGDIRQYAMLQIELDLYHTANKGYHRLNGLVVHHGKHQFGILFTELTQEDTELLYKLIQTQ